MKRVMKVLGIVILVTVVVVAAITIQSSHHPARWSRSVHSPADTRYPRWIHRPMISASERFAFGIPLRQRI